MLLSGGPGTGKSTLIKVLLNEIGVDPFDVLEVNASKDNGVDFIRDKITKFSETMGVGDMPHYRTVKSMELFATQVMPALRRSGEARAPTAV